MTQALDKPWAGIFGGALFWYLAHETGMYFSDYNCQHRGIVPSVHVVCFIAALVCGWLSYRSWPRGDFTFSNTRSFTALLGISASVLFALVIFWQAVAAFIFTGCER